MIDCLAIGMTEEEFWKSNPHNVNLKIKAFNKRYEYQNTMAHLQGLYVRDALLCTVGNMFSKDAKFEYPKTPYGVEEVERELTEEEKQVKLNAFVGNLETMMANFEKNHPKTENENNNN